MKKIKDFPNYSITKHGEVYSHISNKYLKPNFCNSGYLFVNLYKNKKRFNKLIHQIVAINYLNHKPCGQKKVVDHIDNNKTNNNIDNLQIITQRQNSIKSRKNPKSGYKGVYWNEVNKKWQVRLRVNNKKYLLGYYVNPENASKDYNMFCDFIDKTDKKDIKKLIKLYRSKSDFYKNRYNKK